MICSRCILDSRIPSITFDEKGECNYCKMHDDFERDHPISKEKLEEMTDKIEREGRGKRYDCIVGISGGCDSTLLLWKTVELGLKPLAVHFNNNWNTNVAEENMRKVVNELDVDYYEVTVNQQEYDEICRSFLRASVPDDDIPNDIGLATTLYMAAERFKVKNILIGHSFRTEGTTPLDWNYMDGKYIETVQRKFGSLPLKTYPNLWLSSWLKWIALRIKRLRPLWYIDYRKEEVKKLLKKRFDWTWYGGHHLENKYTVFHVNQMLIKKFNMDLRYIEYSAFVRSGQMTRDEAIEKTECPTEINDSIINEVKTRLKLSDKEFKDIMNAPIKTHFDYETYHETFKRWRPFFWLATKANLIPETFYVKYTT